ncbi:MAG: translocation/assembly module TamB domain-containing protein [Armatimonadetes bacterium]|nr:translocation/assembly module TamB domain-containing protein [Armatimonadota bacterium]
MKYFTRLAVWLVLLPTAILAVLAARYIRMELLNAATHLEPVVISQLGMNGRFRVSLRQADASRPGLLVLDDLALALPNRPAGEPPVFQAEGIRIAYNWRSLLGDLQNPQAHVTRIDIISPALTVIRDRQGRWSLPPAVRIQPRKPVARAVPFTGAVFVSSGTARLRDAFVRPGRWEERRFDDIAARFDARHNPVFYLAASAQGQKGLTSLRFDSRFDALRQSQSVDVSARKLDIAFLLPYLPLPEDLKLRSGVIDADVTVLNASGKAEVLGEARIDSAAAQWKEIAARRWAGDVRFTGQSAWADIQGQLQSESIEVQGVIFDWKAPQVALNIEGKIPDPERLASLSPRLAGLRRYVRVASPVSLRARISGPLADPSVTGLLSAQAVDLRQGRYRAQLGRLSLQARYAGKKLLCNLSTRAFQGTVRMNGQADLSGSSPSVVLTARANGLRLGDLRLPFPMRLQGASDIGLSLAYRNNRPDMLMDIQVSQGKFLKTAFQDLKASLRWQGKELIIRGARAQAAGGWLDARGTVSQAGDIDIDLDALDVDLKRMFGPYGNLSLAGIGYLHGRLAGSPGTDPTLIADVQVMNGHMATMAFDLAAGKLEAAKRLVRLIGVQAARFPGSARLDGRIDLEGGAVKGLAFSGHAVHLPLSELFAMFQVEAPAMEGILSGDFTVEGTPGHLTASGPVALREGKVAQVYLPALQGRFRWQDRALTLEEMRGTNNGEHVELEGRYDPDSGFDFAFRASNVPLVRVRSYLEPYLEPEGVGQVEGRVTGEPDRPRVDISVRSERLALNDHPFDRAEGTFRWEAGHLVIERFALLENGAVYEVSPADIDLESHEARLEGAIQDGKASTLVAMLKASPYMDTEAGLKVVKALGSLPRDTEGKISAKFDMEGDLTDPRITIDPIEMSGIQSGPYVRIEKGSAGMELENGAFRIRNLTLSQGDAVVEASGIIDPQGSVALDIDAHNLDASLIRPIIPKRYPVEGLAEISVLVSGRTQTPNIDASVTITDASILGVPFDTVQSQKISWSGNRIDIGEVVFIQKTRQARLYGTAPVPWASEAEKEAVPYDLHAEIARQNLGFLADLYPKVIASADGMLDTRLDITGAGMNRRVSGWFRVADGRMQLARLETPFKNLQADLAFEGTSVKINRLTGESDAGGIRVDGRADLSGLPNAWLDLTVSLNTLHLAGRNLFPAYRERFSGSLSTDRPLTVQGDWNRPLVAGAVTVHDARALLPTQAISAAGGGEGGERGGPVFDPAFDLQVAVGRNAWIQNPRLRALTSGNIAIGGNLLDPSLSGHIGLDRGTIYFPTARFRLTSGDIDFTYNPERGTQAYLTAQAETTMRTRASGAMGGGRTQEYRIALALSGPLDSPLKIEASSNPPYLSERQIYAMLLHQDQVGGILGGQEMERRLGEELGQLFTSAAVPMLFEPVESFLTEALSLEEFAFEYDWKEPLQLRISKRLDDRFLVTYLRSLGTRPLDPRYEKYLFRLTYQVTNRLQLSWDIDERSNQTFTLEGVLRF